MCDVLYVAFGTFLLGSTGVLRYPPSIPDPHHAAAALVLSIGRLPYVLQALSKMTEPANTAQVDGKARPEQCPQCGFGLGALSQAAYGLMPVERGFRVLGCSELSLKE